MIYELIGIITYFKEKGMNEQYFSYCKNEEDEKWYCFCDDCIYDVNNELEKDIDKLNRWPYILFYNEIAINNYDKLIN